MHKAAFQVALTLTVFLGIADVGAQETTIRVNVGQEGKAVSKYLTGSCIEDVNHEIYGGIYSQMIFGESFQEPPRGEPVKGMIANEGRWTVAADGALEGEGGAGPKLLSESEPFTDGEAGVELYLPGIADGNAGLVVRASRAGVGADNFDGYEVSVDVAKKLLVLGRHRHDFRLLKQEPCEVAPDRWIALRVKLSGRMIEVWVDGKRIIEAEDPRPLGPGVVGVRQWQRPARYRKFWTQGNGGDRKELLFEASPRAAIAVSGMWRAVTTGTATLTARVETEQPFTGDQSQRISFTSGEGEAGIENRGLNRQGMNFVAGKPYEGYVWVRAERSTTIHANLESADGSRRYAQSAIGVEGNNSWRRYEFSLTPNGADPSGRFTIALGAPGSIVIGHAFLQPSAWGRFAGLPLRKDVVEGLVAQGVRVMRYGGSMVNASEYRWKNMIGPRDKRPPYRGHWYPQSSNGWGIMDFLDMCEAAGFLGIPDLNVNESPEDLADFIEYVNGSAQSEWGRRRVADGHPKPYRLRHLELGNEERVDDTYFQKFSAIARAVWAKDPEVILVVGDFQYERPITDPMNVRGAASRITSLAAHQKILELAGQFKREVWFDVHVGTEGPATSSSVLASPTYIDVLDKLAAGARHRVVVFELNANNRTQRRALANAVAIGAAQRDGRLAIVTSANALQVDGHNDNGWDQGLLFMNPTSIWFQPPGYVMQMISRSYEPRDMDVNISKPDPRFDVTAAASDDRKTVILRVVNLDAAPRLCEIQLDGFTASKPQAQAEELAAALDATNTSASPDRVKPRRFEWNHELPAKKSAAYTFPPFSFTVLRIE